jgi:hypothetical protein
MLVSDLFDKQTGQDSMNTQAVIVIASSQLKLKRLRKRRTSDSNHERWESTIHRQSDGRLARATLPRSSPSLFRSGERMEAGTDEAENLDDFGDGQEMEEE